MTSDTHESTGMPAGADEPAADDVLAFPASIAQQVFWYLELLQPDVTAFNVPLRFRIDGPLDVRLMERTLDTLVARHETLRSHLQEEDGELLQIVEPPASVPLPLIDISHLPPDKVTDEIDRLATVEACRPFHLAEGPVFRAELIRVSATSHVLHITVHHAFFDGSSMTVLTEELAKVYQALFDGREPELEPLPIQYGDFSVWQKEFLEGPEVAKQLAYWKQRLAGMTEVELPTDRPRPPVKTWKGDIISALLPKELTNRLQTVAGRHGATLFHLLLSAYKILLRRYSGGTDITVGTPITGRTRAEVEPLIGVFINSLLLRTDLSGNPAFGDLLEKVRDTAFGAVENQDLPFECLVRELRPERDSSRNPLFQINFTHQRSFARAGHFGGLEFTPIPSRSPGAIFDLNFFMVERAEGWRVSCDFSTELFDRSTARRMLGHFQRLLEEIAADPSKPIEAYEILTDAERMDVLEKWAVNPRPYPADATIGGLFAESAARFASKTAIVQGDRGTSYGELHAMAGSVAGRLREAGVQPGDMVAISVRPSVEMVAAQLGILLAGAACVPVDPDYPAERASVLLEECGARVALIGVGCGENFSGWNGVVIHVDHSTPGEPGIQPPAALTAAHPAYVLFTSGSTGRPKGVVIPQRAVVRLVKENGFMPMGPDDVFLQTAPASFDASLLEIWGALLNGGLLVIPSDGLALDTLAMETHERGVTNLWLTSGLFQLMIDEHPESLMRVKYLITGGETMSMAHARRALEALPDTVLLNGYGPTENTTFTTTHVVKPADLDLPSMPIGRPIANSSVFILDELGRPVPAGVPGELHCGGDGLALGYLGRPDMTAEKFITHPVHGPVGGIVYKTGDLCRWLADGSIEFIGRRDHQVKVRGFRIELGEIESVLATYPGVKQTKAAVRGDQTASKRILAWVVPAEGSEVDAATLSAWIAGRLPSFMRPDGIAVVGEFPVNANGKIDVAKLPDPIQPQQTAVARDAAPPVGETETRLAALWADMLGLPAVGRNEDFFALGGHSLLALRLFSRINREFGRTLPLSALIGHPTVSRLAALIEPPAEAGTATPSGPVADEKGHVVVMKESGSQPPVFCIHGGDGAVLFYRGLASLMPDDMPMHAVESGALSSDAPIEPCSVEETSASYVRLLLASHAGGPFRLAGYSFGGVVAHEMACQLQELGHTVDFLGLFDTHSPAASMRRYTPAERLAVFWGQNQDVPLASRLSRLKERIADGIATNKRVRSEVEEAKTTGPAEAHSDLRRVQVREENWRAMQAYRPRPFNGRITLFKAMTASDKVEWPEDYGWSALAGTGLDIIPVPGQHLTLFDPGNVESLAAALTRRLKQHGP